jgi:hypothetical protein
MSPLAPLIPDIVEIKFSFYCPDINLSLIDPIPKHHQALSWCAGIG